MDNNLGIFQNICLVVNVPSVGPSYIQDTNPDLFSYDSASMLSARVVVLTGMGLQTSPTKTLQGPVPITELEDSDYEFYFYQLRSSIKKSSAHLILLFVFKNREKNKLKAQEDAISQILNKYDVFFEKYSAESQVLDRDNRPYFKLKLLEIKDELDALMGSSNDDSLYNISFLANLDENISSVAKKIILKPNNSKISDFQEYKDEIDFLKMRGLIYFSDKNGEKFIKIR